MDKVLIQKLRRFSLGIGIILFTYSVAEIELKSPAEISPLGIPLIIKNPNLLGFAIVVASIYAFTRYLYYAVLIGPSPRTVRKRLLSGIMPDGSRLHLTHTQNAFLAFHNKMYAEFSNAFPRVGKHNAEIITFDSNGKLTVRVPRLIKFVSFLEDIDYYSPLWVNAIAWAIYIKQMYL